MSSISAAVPVDPFAVAISYCEQEIQAWQAVVTTTTMTMTPPNVNDTSGGNNNNNKDEMLKLLQQMVTYIQQKLWHQLTITLLQFLVLSLLPTPPESVDVGNVELFYRNVIQTVQNKLHPLAVARMTVLIASSLLRQQPNQSPAAAQAMMEQCAITLKEQLVASSSSASANPTSRRTAGGSSGSSSTGGMIRSTPQSYTEAILYVQCQQALVTFYEYGTNKPPKSPPEMKVALRAIYQKVIQPNASVIQDLLAMATSAAESNTAPTTTTSTTTNSHADVTAQYASTMVHAAYYEMTMHYYRFIAPYTNTFYEHAMQYLQYSNLSSHAAVATAATTTSTTTTNTATTTTTSEDHTMNLQLAIDICWAAILGEGIYNLSVVIEHPFIVQQFHTIPAESNTAAIGGPVVPVSQQYQQWLWSLIHALAMSDYHACTQLLTTLSSLSSSTETPPGFPNIPNVIPMIREKLTLIQLLQLITQVKNTNERSFAFADLQTALQNITDRNDIEIILMRALSIGLIRGTIDQCEQLVHITYIQPQRVLTTTQMQHLLQQYQFWSQKVQTNVQQVQEQTNVMTTTTNNNSNIAV
jgi:hypothetical protein